MKFWEVRFQDSGLKSILITLQAWKRPVSNSSTFHSLYKPHISYISYQHIKKLSSIHIKYQYQTPLTSFIAQFQGSNIPT